MLSGEGGVWPILTEQKSGRATNTKVIMSTYCHYYKFYLSLLYKSSKIHFCWHFQICKSPYASWLKGRNPSISLFNISSTKQRPWKVLRDTKIGLVSVLSKSHILTSCNLRFEITLCQILYYNVFLKVKDVAKCFRICVWYMCCISILTCIQRKIWLQQWLLYL